MSHLPNFQYLNEALRWAPSPDNCQPWKWSWMDNSLEVFHVPERAQHFFNRKDHASLLSLGGLFESLMVAASKEGFQVVLDTFEFHQEPSKPVLRVQLEHTGREADELAPSLFHRVTDRRLFNRTQLDVPISEGIKRQASHFKVAKMHMLTDFDAELINLIASVEPFLWFQPKATSDFLKWIRFDHLDEAVDGLTWKSLAINAFQKEVIHSLKKWPGLLTLLRVLGLNRGVKKLTRKQILSSSVLILFSASERNDKAIFEAGRLALRVWVFLNSRGFGVQPLSQSSLTVFDFADKNLDPDLIHPKLKTHFENGVQQLRTSFSVPKNETPIWMFRAGVSSTLDPEMRSKRIDQKSLQRFHT